jgi:hypothetical protein
MTTLTDEDIDAAEAVRGLISGARTNIVEARYVLGHLEHEAATRIREKLATVLPAIVAAQDALDEAFGFSKDD